MMLSQRFGFLGALAGFLSARPDIAIPNVVPEKGAPGFRTSYRRIRSRGYDYANGRPRANPLTDSDRFHLDAADTKRARRMTRNRLINARKGVRA